MSFIRFLKDWTLPVAIAVGSVSYLTFRFVPCLDTAGENISRVVDIVFPFTVFLTLLVTFIKVDFHQMRPHRWQIWTQAAQLTLVVLAAGLVFLSDNDIEQKLLLESMLTCVIAPAASASPVVTGKLGGNISTMTAYVLVSAFFSSLLIPTVFPLLEPSPRLSFFSAFLVILQKVAIVLLLPLALGWLIQHKAPQVQKWVATHPDLGFYCWSFSLAITSGITVKNIFNASVSPALLIWVALFSLAICWIQFAIGRAIGSRFGEKVNSGQAMFQKNTALAIWVSYMYLHPVASLGAGCYVVWQNIINSLELWHFRRIAKAQ